LVEGGKGENEELLIPSPLSLQRKEKKGGFLQNPYSYVKQPGRERRRKGEGALVKTFFKHTPQRRGERERGLQEGKEYWIRLGAFL